MQAAATKKQLRDLVNRGQSGKHKAKPGLILGCGCFDFTSLTAMLITPICRGIPLTHTYLDNVYYHTESIIHI